MAAPESTDGITAALEPTFRSEWSRVVASLIASTGDWDLAQDCAQEAFGRALSRWPLDGMPRRPGAWLTAVARNCAVDQLRRRDRESAALGRWADAALIEARPPGDDGLDHTDERLALLFTCCHPALPLNGQVALTLRYVAGLTTEQIAAAFLVAEPTMAKRLVRAKAKIAHTAIPFRVPSADRIGERTAAVLGVLYLLFNQGYVSSDVADLSGEAIRLARATRELLPNDEEIAGLLALMLLQHSRRDARRNGDGNIIPLPEQDRQCWHHNEIAEGVALLDQLGGEAPGPYTVQARIAACHATALNAADTDWRSILGWYDALARMTSSPVVELNRVVAVAEVHGAEAALAVLKPLVQAGSLARYHLLWVVRADLRQRTGDLTGAIDDLKLAISLVATDDQRRRVQETLTEMRRHDNDDENPQCFDPRS